jgi:hypothetical protein
MWKWIWPKVGSNPISQNTDSEMFDRSDYPYTETFVREAIQNTLDAILDESRPAVISFRFHKGPASAVKSLIGAAIDLRTQAGVSVPSEWIAGQANWLTIEDFNTKGLDGDLSDRLGNFWNYWLNFGLSNKDGHGRGGRGIGRVTFLIASRIQAVLGLTRRKTDGRTAASGMVMLRAMRAGGGLRATHGYLASSENAEQSIFNLYDSNEFHAEIIRTFNLSGYAKEPDRTGLALIIPYPHADLTADGIVASAIEHFAPAILDGSLQVRADDRVLDKASIDEIAADVTEQIHTEWIRDDVCRYLTLLRHAKAAEPVIFNINPSEKLGNRRDSAEAKKLQKTLAGGEPVVCEFRFPLVQRSVTHNVSLRAVAARTPDGHRPADRLFREGMSLPDVRASMPGETDVLILVDDVVLATYLNFCEGKAHLDLLESKEIKAKLEEKGYRPVTTVRRFVKFLPSEFRALLTPDIIEPELDVFDTFFALPDDQPGKRKGPGGRPDVTPPVPPPPLSPPRIPAVRVKTLDDGFRIEANPDYEGWPVNMSVTMAYADGSRNPAWSPFDFKPADLETEANDCEYNFTKNKLIAKNCGKDCSIVVSGFDNRREVDTRIKVWKHA